MAAILVSFGFTFLIDRMTEVLTPDIYIELTGVKLHPVSQLLVVRSDKCIKFRLEISICKTTHLFIFQEGGETTEITEVITKCSTHEARLLMEHFLNKTIQLVEN
jgi:hypothetical protein